MPKYKSYQRSPVFSFILCWQPALELLGWGITSSLGRRNHRSHPKSLHSGIWNSLSDVCRTICLVGIFLMSFIFFYRFFLMFICFSWHLKGTWLLGVIIILHMLYGVCLLPDNWGTDVCSLEAGGEEREGWEVQGMDDGAAEAGAAEQCWVLQGGFPFITTSHTSLGSNSN